MKQTALLKSQESQQFCFFYGDVLSFYDQWENPIVIISDGPYGIGSYPGDPKSPEGLGKWYEPHILKWSSKATPQTTLWFWNTEVGWATVHPILAKNGWSYRACHIWDKGMAHIAGNSNTQRLRKLPVVTEICAHYVREPEFYADSKKISMKEWLVKEWKRTGLPFRLTNKACGVIDAATRKYFTLGHLWYFPPPEAMEQIAAFANREGKQEGKPYFSLNGKDPINKQEWKMMRAKFYCPLGITNVWHEPPVNGNERIRNGTKAFHMNQKPLRITENIITMTSDEGDVVWDPFGGLFTTAIACYRLKRKSYSAEINQYFYDKGLERFKKESSILFL